MSAVEQIQSSLGNVARSIGEYCGQCWAGERLESKTNKSRMRQQLHHALFEDFCLELCRGEVDGARARQDCYIDHFGSFGINTGDLDKLPEFWQGFTNAANKAIDAKFAEESNQRVVARRA